MRTSESIKEIAAALSKAQAKIMGAVADTENPFFKSKYARLDSCIDAIREAFAENGLSYFQSTNTSNFKYKIKMNEESEYTQIPTIETMIMHTSGEWLRSEPLEIKCDNQNNPQKIAAANTYYRRIQLCGMVGLAQVDDNDGNDLVDPDKKDNEAKKPQSKPVNHAPNKAGGISEAQAKKLYAMGASLGWSKDDFVKFVKDNTGKINSKDLNKDEFMLLESKLKSEAQLMGAKLT